MSANDRSLAARVPRFAHGSRVPGWDEANDLTKDPAVVPDPVRECVAAEFVSACLEAVSLGGGGGVLVGQKPSPTEKQYNARISDPRQ